MDSVADYLRIPEEYARCLGALRWAASGEAIEYPDGETFAMRQEVALFLEGMTANGRRPVHFGHVLHLMKLFGHGRTGVAESPPAAETVETFGKFLLHRPRPEDCPDFFRASDPRLPGHTWLLLRTSYNGQTCPDEAKRFIDASAKAAFLRHRNIAPVCEINAVDGVGYVTFGPVDGRSLASFLDETPTWSVGRCVRLVRSLALAMAEAYADPPSLVDNDVGPHKILIDRTGEPIILGIGLTEHLRPVAAFTPTTPPSRPLDYLDPDTVRGRSTSYKFGAVTYALGILLYRILTGRSPFDGEDSVEERIKRILRQHRPSPREYRPELDPVLATACLKAIAHDPKDRYPTLQAFAEALAPFATPSPRYYPEVGPTAEDQAAVKLLRDAYREAKRPLRNAGVLAAVLCRAVPPVAFPIEPKILLQKLASGALITELALLWANRSPTVTQEQPALEPPWFEAAVAAVLRDMTPKDLGHWLRHGCEPLPDTADTVILPLHVEPPRTVADLLERLTERPRLAGALPFVDQLVSAVALPPRALRHEELPTGGYSDITTRGHPEQLLLSQFALDGAEFVRRFAEHELLYFRREEPNHNVRDEVVVLLDQGVRTWGEVRLLLGAAVIALGRLATRRGRAFRLATTGNRGTLIDPQAVGPDAVGNLLEASDLSPHPALALEHVLEQPATVPRDVVLLTHPRNLNEPDVLTAGRRACRQTRLFALAIDAAGVVAFDEFRHGTAVPKSRARLDLDKGRRAKKPRRPSPAPAGWVGDVEPIGWPFRFGLVDPLTTNGMAFDRSGDWLLTMTNQGVLHAWKTDGSREMEILPRACQDGTLLSPTGLIPGVTGGFAVTGTLGGPQAVAHYDLVARRVTVYRMAAATQEAWKWYYFPALHSVALRARALAYAVDLATGARHAEPEVPSADDSRTVKVRAQQACVTAGSHLLPAPSLYVVPADGSRGLRGPHIHFDPSAGMITVHGMPTAWAPFTPFADGRPVLAGHQLRHAQCWGGVLAATFSAGEFALPTTLRLFQGPTGVPLAEFPLSPTFRSGFMLSPCDRWLVIQLSNRSLRVYDLANNRHVAMDSFKGRGQGEVRGELGDGWLDVWFGGWRYLLIWADGTFVSHVQHRNNPEIDRAKLLGGRGSPGPKDRSGELVACHPLHPLTRYDKGRFCRVAETTLAVVIDRYGQITFLSRAGTLIAQVLVSRRAVAAAMPDGTRLGPSELTGGPETADAPNSIAEALLDAARNPLRTP